MSVKKDRKERKNHLTEPARRCSVASAIGRRRDPQASLQTELVERGRLDHFPAGVEGAVIDHQ